MELTYRFQETEAFSPFGFGNCGVRASMRAATIFDDSLSASGDVTGAEGGFDGGWIRGSATGIWSSRNGEKRVHLL